MEVATERGAGLVLVVDDLPEVRRLAARWLGREGFVVDEAASGEEGLTALARRLPDVVLLDLEMPGMGGLATLDEMIRRHPALPVVMLSGHDDAQTAVLLMSHGAAGFLAKPFDRASLIETTRSAMVTPAR